jgi:two-component SAPR family response regulator
MNSPTLLCIDDGCDAIKMLEEASVAAVLTGVQTGRHGRGGRTCHIKKRFPSLPIILLSAYCEMPERILWLVDDYVMKSELPERLLTIIERVHKRLDERCQRSGAAA